MKFTVFEFSVENRVAHIRLNQPALGNPFNEAFCTEFKLLANVCADDPEIGCVYIDAAGPNFSLGGDIKQFTEVKGTIPSKFRHMTADLHMGVARFARGDAPVVMAANGYVVGGAVALVAAADFVFAEPKTRFYAAFSAIALCGDTGISHFLPRRVGSRKATEFMLRNETWGSDKALASGLINEIFEPDELSAKSKEQANQLAQGPTEVFGRMRRMLLSSFDQSIDTQLELEARSMVECAQSEHSYNAMIAILSHNK